MEFKRRKTDGLFEFLNVSIPGTVNPADETTRALLAARQFRYALGLSKYLSANLESYIIARNSPLLSGLPFFKLIGSVGWQYELIADDIKGLGIDNGFVSTVNLHLMPNRLFAIGDILVLSQIPEDSFGDSVSCITIFSIQHGRQLQLSKFLHQAHNPQLGGFLLTDELFIHIITAKEQTYYDAVLIKSRDNIEDRIYAFQNVIDPNN